MKAGAVSVPSTGHFGVSLRLRRFVRFCCYPGTSALSLPALSGCASLAATRAGRLRDAATVHRCTRATTRIGAATTTGQHHHRPANADHHHHRPRRKDGHHAPHPPDLRPRRPRTFAHIRVREICSKGGGLLRAIQYREASFVLVL